MEQTDDDFLGLREKRNSPDPSLKSTATVNSSNNNGLDYTIKPSLSLANKHRNSNNITHEEEASTSTDSDETNVFSPTMDHNISRSSNQQLKFIDIADYDKNIGANFTSAHTFASCSDDSDTASDKTATHQTKYLLNAGIGENEENEYNDDEDEYLTEDEVRDLILRENDENHKRYESQHQAEKCVNVCDIINDIQERNEKKTIKMDKKMENEIERKWENKFKQQKVASDEQIIRLRKQLLFVRQHIHKNDDNDVPAAIKTNFSIAHISSVASALSPLSDDGGEAETPPLRRKPPSKYTQSSIKILHHKSPAATSPNDPSLATKPSLNIYHHSNNNFNHHEIRFDDTMDMQSCVEDSNLTFPDDDSLAHSECDSDIRPNRRISQSLHVPVNTSIHKNYNKTPRSKLRKDVKRCDYVAEQQSIERRRNKNKSFFLWSWFTCAPISDPDGCGCVSKKKAKNNNSANTDAKRTDMGSDSRSEINSDIEGLGISDSSSCTISDITDNTDND